MSEDNEFNCFSSSGRHCLRAFRRPLDAFQKFPHGVRSEMQAHLARGTASVLSNDDDLWSQSVRTRENSWQQGGSGVGTQRKSRQQEHTALISGVAVSKV